MIDRFFDVLLRAGVVAPFLTPTIGTAAAETDNADDLRFLRKPDEVGRHRTSRGMAEGDDRTAGEILIGEKPGTLKNDIEGAFQIAVANLFLGQIAIEKVDEIAFGDRLFPHSAGRVMSRIGER